MSKKRPANAGNPLKSDGQTKSTTRQAADRSAPTPRRAPATQTVTGQGGSRKGGGESDTHHRSQRGGVKPELSEIEEEE